MWQSLHGAQQVAYALFRRQSPEVKQRCVFRGAFRRCPDRLKVRKHLEPPRIPSVFDKLVPHKFTGCKKAVHAFFVRSHPFVQVCLCHQSNPRAPSRIALLFQSMPEFTALARLASFSPQHQVVARTQNLEVVQVVDDRNLLRLQLPQDRRRQVVINIPHVRHIRPEIRDHPPYPPPRLAGVNRTPGQPHLLEPPTALLEVDVGHEMAIVWRGTALRICHGKQCHFMPPGSQQFHGFEQVNLGATKGIVIFVAKQDSHEGRSILELQNSELGGNPAQRSLAETGCQIELDSLRD